MTSVNTNVGSMVALADLQVVETNLGVTEKRISTGLRVSGAEDDASDFAVAQVVRGTINAGLANEQNLAGGVGIGQTAIAGVTSVSNLLNSMKSKAIEASNPANTATQQSILANDFNAMIQQLNTFISNAVYNGRNLISAGSASVGLMQIAGGSLMLNNVSSVAGVSAALSSGVATTAAALALLSTIDAEALVVGSALGSLGADVTMVNLVQTFFRSQIDALTEGLGALVDANLPRESAKLQALQVQQQLAVQALSIANQRPEIILSLFR